MRRWKFWMVGALLLLCVGGIAFTLCGCGYVPTERSSTLDQKQRENVAQKATSDFAVSTKPDPLNIEIQGKDGSKTVIKQPVTAETKASASAGENSDSEAKGNSAASSTIPIFVKLIGTAVGVALLAGVVWFIVSKVKALKAAWEYADGAFANAIHSVRSQQTASTDPNVIASLKAAEANLERERAELNKD